MISKVTVNIKRSNGDKTIVNKVLRVMRRINCTTDLKDEFRREAKHGAFMAATHHVRVLFEGKEVRSDQIID